MEYNESTHVDLKRLGRKAGWNRVRMFRKHAESDKIPLFIWAAFGEAKRTCFPVVDGN